MTEEAWLTKLAQLRATRQWFDLFASVDRGGQRFMTMRDVLRALTLFKDAEALETLLSPDAVARLQTVFALADTDYDGFVSYSEFLFFLKLLATSPDRIGIAFRMFDLDGSGKLDVAELGQVLRAHRDASRDTSTVAAPPTAPLIPVKRTGVYAAASGGMTQQAFTTLIANMQNDVLTMQIGRAVNPVSWWAARVRLYVRVYTAPDGTMSVAQLGRIVVVTANMLPDGANQLRTLPRAVGEHARGGCAQQRLSAAAARSFLAMLNDIAKIRVALQFIAKQGVVTPGALATDNIVEAAARATGYAISETQAKMLHHLLDRDNDGVITNADVLRWYRKRRALGSERTAAGSSAFEIVRAYVDCVHTTLEKGA